MPSTNILILTGFFIIIVLYLWKNPFRNISQEIKYCYRLIKNDNAKKAMDRLKNIVINDIESVPKEKREAYIKLIQGLLGQCNYIEYTYDTTKLGVLEQGRINLENSLENFPQEYKKSYYNLLNVCSSFYDYYGLYENRQENLEKSKEFTEAMISGRKYFRGFQRLKYQNSIGINFIKYYKEMGDITNIVKAIEILEEGIRVSYFGILRSGMRACIKIRLSEAYIIMAEQSEDRTRKYFAKAEKLLIDSERFFIERLKKTKETDYDRLIVSNSNLGFIYSQMSKIKYKYNYLKMAESNYTKVADVLSERNLAESSMYKSCYFELENIRSLLNADRESVV